VEAIGGDVDEPFMSTNIHYDLRENTVGVIIARSKR